MALMFTVIVGDVLCISVLIVLLHIRKRVNLLWTCLRSFLDTMQEMGRQIDEFRKVTEPEAWREEEPAGLEDELPRTKESEGGCQCG
jgi:hypothetical protein